MAFANGNPGQPRAARRQGSARWNPTASRQHRFSYLVALEHARRIRLNPSLLAEASSHMDRRLPEYRAGEDMWRGLLADGVEAVVTALTDRSPSGDYARETAPAFGGIPAHTRRELLASAYLPLDATTA